MKKHFFLAFLTFSVLWLFPAGAEEFFYKHRLGDRYRVLSTVHEDVYIDNFLSHRAEILNRITVEVIAESEGKGTHKAVFQTSELAEATRAWGNYVPQSYQWSREYESEFERDTLGRMTIDRKYYMPVVRDVPVFPGRNLEVGEKWSNEGHEVHDFRDNFGIRDPYRIPFTANYEYLGEREWKGESYPAFSVSYRIRSEPPRAVGRIWPRRITGESDQIVFWDSESGQPVAYFEEFRFILELSDGKTIEYRGFAEAEIVESLIMDKEQIAEEIIEELQRLDIDDVSVRVVDEGITISLDNIQFHPDTAIMLPGEGEKLDKIVEILKRYQERDILVSGHTALAGTVEARNRLSTQRASIVADYLINRGARTRDRVVVRGYGAERPLADNSTEEGMRRNRRVEITILEN